MMANIIGFELHLVLDSSGNQTVQAVVTTANGVVSRAVPPSGPLFTRVAPELEGWSDYLENCGSQVVDDFNRIIGLALIGMDATDQFAIDNLIVQRIDGAFNNWGWRELWLVIMVALAVSLAVCKAGASVKKIPLNMYYANLASNPKLVLPVPAFNLINMLAMQEFMILPVGASSFKEAMKMGVEVHHHLNAVIKKKYGLDGTIISWPPLSDFMASPFKVAMKMGVEVYHYLKAVIMKKDATNVGDEGGFAPNIQENKEGLELLKTAIAKAGYTGKVVIGMDVIASEFHGEDEEYDLNFKEENNDGSGDAPKDLYWEHYWEHYKNIMAESVIVSIEDPFDQDDWEDYSKLTAEIGEKVQIVGDDLLVINPKVNQIGSVTESIEAVKMSERAGCVFMTTISFV